jgi:hypothetical protein
MLAGNLVVHMAVDGFPIVAILRKPQLELCTRDAVALPVRRQVLLEPFTCDVHRDDVNGIVPVIGTNRLRTNLQQHEHQIAFTNCARYPSAATSALASVT